MDYVDLIRERQTSEAGLEAGSPCGTDRRTDSPKGADPVSSRAPRFPSGKAQIQHKHHRKLRQTQNASLIFYSCCTALKINESAKDY